MIPLAIAAVLAVQSEEEFQRFLRSHCVSCHGERVRKGRLRLDPPAPSDRARVLDALRENAMPPKAKPRPPRRERDAVIAWLTERIAAGEASRPRTVLRRLNRRQYENTLRDLLGVPHLEVSRLLPADGEAHGFDTVAEALQLSAVQMERYLEASAAALEEAQAVPAASRVQRYEVREESRFRTGREGVGWVRHGDRVLLVCQPMPAAAWWKLGRFRFPSPGLYRFRLNCFGVTWNRGTIGPADRSHALLLYAASSSGALRWIATCDVPSDRLGVVEFAARIGKGEDRLILVAGTLPPPLDAGSGAAGVHTPSRYAGPAIAFGSVEAEGPLGGPPPARTESLESFAARAFRRPLAGEDLLPYRDFPPERARQAVLCSPDFLFLRETPGPLDPFAVASRLSYFLWNSAPDETLLALAREGSLTWPDELGRQVERLLADPKAERFIEDFATQWLGLRRLDAAQPDALLYPEFDLLLLESMRKETFACVTDMIRRDLGVSHLVDSDFLFVNGRLARHYGIAGVEGVRIRRVDRPAGSPRGGLLTQASVLTATANGTTTSPVLRGAWVLDRLLGRPSPPPPEEVPAVEPDVRGAVTIREQLARHRDQPSCARCHARIDPPGFALESFDVMGGWRERYRSLEKGDPVGESAHGWRVRYRLGPRVDAAGEMESGASFRGIREFKAILLQDLKPLARNLVERLIVYATGSGIRTADRAAVDEILSRTRSGGYGLRSLIREVVRSRLFLTQ